MPTLGEFRCASIPLRRCAVRYYDISLNLSTDTVRWVVAPPLEVHERRRISRGDEVNASALTVSVHAGTHVDAPLHFVPGGVSIDAVPLERFVGPAVVHQVDADRFITEAPGRYELICFPLRLRGLDGAPCRAVLRDLTG